MKIPCEEYFLTHSIDEVLSILSAANGSARVLAGGSDILLELQQGICPPIHTLVDVSEIDEMCRLEVRNRSFFIGAAVTLSRIAHSSLIEEHAQALMDAAVQMANPQVCNVATLGGNVAHALPAADGTIALLALDATAEVANVHGRRRLPLKDLFKGPGESTLEEGADLLVGFYLPLHEKGQASAFSRRVNPQGIALAMLNMTIWLKRDGDQVIDARIAVGPSGPVPRRIHSAEQALIDQSPSQPLLELVREKLLSEAHFRTSAHRATEQYRQHLAGILLHEAFTAAWQRAG